MNTREKIDRLKKIVETMEDVKAQMNEIYREDGLEVNESLYHEFLHVCHFPQVILINNLNHQIKSMSISEKLKMLREMVEEGE